MSTLTQLRRDDRVLKTIQGFAARRGHAMRALQPRAPEGTQTNNSHLGLVVVLDATMSSMDVTSLCRELQRRCDAPVVMLSAREAGGPIDRDAESSSFRFAGWTLDVNRRELIDEQGDPVRLTGAEFRLLKALVEHPNEVLSRDQLMVATKGEHAGPYDRSVDMQVARLRRKLGDRGPDFELLRTAHGEGYVLTANVRRA